MLKQTLATGNIQDYREVTVYFVGGNRTTRLFHKNNVAQFVEATVKLHHKPGVNPHSKLTTAPVWRVTSSPLAYSGPYWWTARTLNADNTGARFLEGSYEHERIEWEDAEYVKEQIRLEMEAEARAEAS